MAFALSGPNQAYDDASGHRVTSLEPRGAEIENNWWRVEGDDLSFEFSTRVGDEGDDIAGKRRIRLYPDAQVIDYLIHDPGEASTRKAIIDKMVAGIVFMIPQYYLRPFFVERGPALRLVASETGQAEFRLVEAPGLWNDIDT